MPRLQTAVSGKGSDQRALEAQKLQTAPKNQVQAERQPQGRPKPRAARGQEASAGGCGDSPAWTEGKIARGTKELPEQSPKKAVLRTRPCRERPVLQGKCVAEPKQRAKRPARSKNDDEEPKEARQQTQPTTTWLTVKLSGERRPSQNLGRLIENRGTDFDLAAVHPLERDVSQRPFRCKTSSPKNWGVEMSHLLGGEGRG